VGVTVAILLFFFYPCVGQRVIGRAGSRGAVMRGMKHDEIYICVG